MHTLWDSPEYQRREEGVFLLQMQEMDSLRPSCGLGHCGNIIEGMRVNELAATWETSGNHRGLRGLFARHFLIS